MKVLPINIFVFHRLAIMQEKIVHHCGMKHRPFFRVCLIPDCKRNFFWNNKSPIEYLFLVTPKFMPPTIKNIFHQKKVKTQKRLTKNILILMQLNWGWPSVTQLISSIDLSQWFATGNVFCKTMWPWLIRGSQAFASCIQITDNYTGLMEIFTPAPLSFSICWLSVVPLFCSLDSLIKNELRHQFYQ